jgi:16S rRNA (adenine1518-N6/adenine1519-N6)-dimethyltransferase
MKLNEMRQILDQRGILLTKSLGQNFLHDENQLKRIVDAAALNASDQVLEVGPGLGPLTEWLVAYAGSVTAIEVDQRLVAFLRERFVAVNNLTLIHADALQYLKDHRRDWSSWKLVANLPYSVASPLLVELALGGNGPLRMVTTLQLEVAKRLIAKADTDEYGVLTLLLRLDYQARIAFRVPPSCFFPAPDVDSSCVVLEKRVRPLLPPASRRVYVSLVKLAFSQRRKMMMKLLKATWPEETLQKAFVALKLPADIRAEKVELEGFVALAEMLTA